MTQVTKIDVKIILTVSSKYLYETENPTPADVEKLCLLSDDHIGNMSPIHLMTQLQMRILFPMYIDPKMLNGPENL